MYMAADMRSWAIGVVAPFMLLGAAACSSNPTEPDDQPPPGEEDPSPIAVDDDFERTTLGSAWTIYNGDPGIVSSSDLGALSNPGGFLSGLALVGRTAEVFSADQFSEVTLSPNLHPDVFVQVWVRRRVSDNQRYGFHWQDSPGLYVLKLDGSNPTFELVTAPAPRPGPGDVLRIEVSGTTIRGFVNGTQVLQTTNTVLTGGVPGVAINVNRGNIPPGDFPVAAAESWSGGDLGG